MDGISMVAGRRARKADMPSMGIKKVRVRCRPKIKHQAADCACCLTSPETATIAAEPPAPEPCEDDVDG
jgi:hypothetical protein